MVTRNTGDPGTLLASVEEVCLADPSVRALVGRIVGTHQRNLGELAASIDTLTHARRAATETSQIDLADEIAITLAGAHAMAGDTAFAEEIVTEIADRPDDMIGLKARAQLGAFASYVGDVPRQVAILEGLAEAFVEHEEFEWAARSFANYGWGLFQLGRARESLEPLEESRRIWLELGSPEMASQPLNHVAVAYAVLGRPSEALAAIRLANAGRELTPDDRHGLIELYEQAGLVDDALLQATADRAESTTSRDRGLAESYLARLSYTVGRYEQAAESAERAVVLLTDADAHDLAADAAVVAVAARQRLDRTRLGDLERLDAVPAETRTGRFARIVKGDILVSAGDLDGAQRHVDAMGSAEVGLVGRLEADRLQARILDERGDHASSVAKVRESLRSLGDLAATLTSTDLTVAARSLGATLAEFGIGVALRQRDVSALVGIIDDLRVIDAPPEVRPSPEVSELLATYRRSRRATATDLADVERELREAIRRSATGARTRASTLPFDATVAELGSRQLIMFFEHADDIYRVDANVDDAVIEPIGKTQELETLAAKIRMRLVSLLAGPTLGSDHLAGLMATVGRLGDLLLGSVSSDEVVLLPPPSVFGVPWATLPAFSETSIVVNSSWSGWVHANQQSQVDDLACLFVAGPDLRAAVAEVDELADSNLGDLGLAGSDATGEAVKRALPTRQRAHLAAHGLVRPDAPVLSQLVFADGPLTLYEMQGSMPAELILSACSVGRERTYRGGLAVGFPAVALASGSRSVVAPEVDVPDGATRRVMVRYHELRRGGLQSAAALQQARQDLSRTDPAAWLTALAFNAYGA